MYSSRIRVSSRPRSFASRRVASLASIVASHSSASRSTASLDSRSEAATTRDSSRETQRRASASRARRVRVDAVAFILKSNRSSCRWDGSKGPIVDARARMSSPTRETTRTSDGDGRGTFTADDALEATLSEAVRENLEAHCVENARFSPTVARAPGQRCERVVIGQVFVSGGTGERGVWVVGDAVDDAGGEVSVRQGVLRFGEIGRRVGARRRRRTVDGRSGEGTGRDDDRARVRRRSWRVEARRESICSG